MADKSGMLFEWFKRRYWNGKEDKATYKRIFHMTWPAFIELFLASLFGVIDLAMVGNLEEPAAQVAGVGITGQPFNLLIAIFAAVNVGTTALVSWSYGAGERKRMSFVAWQAILFNGALGVVMMVIGLLLNRPVLGLMSPYEDVVGYGVIYMRIICWGLPFQAITMCVNAALRGCGQTRIPMFYNVGSNLIDVFLNYAMVYGKFGFPAMGIAGAALSTSIVRAMACIAALSVLIFWKNSPIRIRLREHWKPDLKTMKEMIMIGLPAAGEQFVMQTGLMLYQIVIAQLGKYAQSAHQVACSINGMAWSISQAFSVCTSALVGQSLGANDPEQARRYTLFTRRLARVFTAVAAVLFIIFARPLAYLFIRDKTVVDIAVPVLWVVAAVQYVQSALMCTSGALRGAGDTMYPLYASLLGIWCFRLIVAYVFVMYFHWGLVGAWCAFFGDQVIRSVFINRRFKSGKWLEVRKKKLSMADEEAAY